jgi:TonB-linked SusC/RagA family outer membrane protein
MKNRESKNLYGCRFRFRWLFLFGLLASPLTPPLEMHAADSTNITQQQKQTISGRVVDGNGEPIIGANVVVEGQTTGTITDIDGNFHLSVAKGAKLKISFIGYATKTVIAKAGNMEIVLEDDSQQLGEVEVVAYGVQKKVSVTGAISSVKGEELTKTPTGSVSNMLSGQMAGLTTVQYSGEPGSDEASLFVRGQATWNQSSPLIQVDGVERSMNDIDPNEIESISILKDASATAVFGVRGANGVVLITTKRGKEGKAKISFSTSASAITPTESIKMANSYQYATFYNQVNAGDGVAPTFSDEVIQKFKDGSDPIRFPSTDWIDYCLKDMTLQTQHNVNISGGTSRVRYFISAGSYTQGGLFKEFTTTIVQTWIST